MGKALNTVCNRHNDTHDLKYYFEIDKYASNSFSAIQGVSEDLNLWDITQNIEVPEVDIFFYSPPCQTFSIAGKKEGRTVAKGNLFDSALDKLKKSNPKFAIMENVSNLANQFKKDYLAMLKDLENAGYVNYSKILNSKHYGIPQNRERIFIVSIRKDIYNSGLRFEFPKQIELKLKLKDMLQDNVHEKYYLSQKLIDCFINHTNKHQEKGNGFKFEPSDGNNVAKAVTTKAGTRADDNYIKVPSATLSGYEIACEYDSINLDQLDSKTRRGRVGKQQAQTLTTSCNQAVVMQIGNISESDSFGGNPQVGRIYSSEGISPTLSTMQGGGQEPKIIDTHRIRKLTPLECFRLQGFSGEDYYKAVQAYESKWKPGKSDAQMYMRAGNSITVNVIVEILENLLYQRKQSSQISMF